jgi:hypothetical protein
MPELLRILEMVYAEHDFGWPFDPVLLSMSLSNAIDDENSIVLVGNGAMLWASAFDSPLGAGKMAVEHVIRAKAPGQFSEIVAAYEDWARGKGCVKLALGCVRSHRAFGRLYARAGYHTEETWFSKSL